MTNPKFKPWPSKGGDPIMTELFRRANEARITRKELSARSGVGTSNMAMWIKGHSANTKMVAYCFEAIEQVHPTDRVELLISQLREEIKK